MLSFFRDLLNRRPPAKPLGKAQQAHADQAALDERAALFAEGVANENFPVIPRRPLPPVSRGYRGRAVNDP